MAKEIYKEQQKQQTSIQATKEAEELAVNFEEFKQREKEEGQVTKERVRQMTQASEKIMRADNFSDTDDSDPANPPMEFADEQQRQWYDRKRAAVVEKQLGEE